MQRPHWSSLTKVVVSLLLMVLGIYLLSRFSAVLKPLVLAVILAFVFSPLVNTLQQRLGTRRGLAVLLAYLIVLVSLVAIVMVIVPPLMVQSHALRGNIHRIVSQGESLFDKQYTILGQTIVVDNVVGQLSGSVQGLLEPIFGQTMRLVIEVISSLVWVVFIVIVSFYLIKDSAVLTAWLERLPPPAYREDFGRLMEEINRIWASFFRGQLVLAGIVAFIFTMVGFAIGMPFALAMGVLAGLLEFLPSLGHGIWMVIASLLAFFVGSTWLPIPSWAFALIVIGLDILFQQFDLNYLIPRVIGRSVHLPPLVVILGIVAGALLAGVLGILLAAPTIASARVIGRYIYANLLDLEPFPDQVTEPLPPPNPRWWRKNVPHDINEVHDDALKETQHH